MKSTDTQRHGFIPFVFFLILISLLASNNSFATHLRAGEITLTRQNCSSLTFNITITVYTNTGSSVRFGDGLLDFGDGSNPLTTPTIENTVRPDLGDNVGIVVFTTTHTFPGPGKYVISYYEHNRNAGILNMNDSVDTPFYIETSIDIDPFLGCDNTPRLLVPPIDKGCTGATWYHNPGAYDPDGDSLSYQLTIPKQDKNINVGGYKDPNAQAFYSTIGLNYGTSNQAQTGAPGFSMNSTTGTITWDAPGAPGEYNIAFLVIEWRKIGGTWIQLGYVERDMQIVIEDCKNKHPIIQVPPDICVEAGTVIKQDIIGTDPDYDSVKMQAFSEVFTLNPSPATYTPNPVIYQATSPTSNAVLKFTWNTKCEHIREQPYQVVFKINDKPSQGPSLVQFQTWNIRVVAPAPKWVSASVDASTRTSTLQWQPYACQITNTMTMQVWRRIDSYPYDPPDCVTGMPDIGYTLIATVPITTTSYVDKGLAAGAQYCYRLVAIFPQPKGGESYVSKEICIPPFLSKGPIITNVTVDKTDKAAGQITVKWRPPLDVDPTKFPPPYSYQVLRAEGATGASKLFQINGGKQPDTTFVDNNNGANTLDNIYNYRVIAYDNNNIKLDTSDVASSVWLTAAPKFKEIDLTWKATVPWSMNIQAYPMHLIYRGTNGATEDQLTLIDSVNVNQMFFHYIDSGQYNSTALDVTKNYCYKVMTRGGYGNPRIKEPLINFSQINCAQPDDKTPPCKPVMAAVGVNCDDFSRNYSCGGTNVYSNVVTWKKPADATCLSDTYSYNVYVAAHVGDEYVKYATVVADTFFIDANLPSFARCYKISAVDKAGNESALSDSFCFDNCPYYELPNVFTPNGDKCNDTFSAFSDRTKVGEGGITDCGTLDPDQLLDRQKRCARFVLSVDFAVYNRWGGEVYSFQSGGENTIYIDWNGKDNQGKDMPAGVYYFLAKVTFDVVDPTKQKQNIKGWVQIMR